MLRTDRVYPKCRMAKWFRQNTFLKKKKKRPKFKDQEDGYEDKAESNREEEEDRNLKETNM